MLYLGLPHAIIIAERKMRIRTFLAQQYPAVQPTWSLETMEPKDCVDSNAGAYPDNEIFATPFFESK